MKDLKDTIYNICIYNDKTLRANALPKKVKYPRLVEYQGGRRYSPLGLYDPAIFGYADHCDCPKVRQTTFTGTPVMCPSCHKMVYGVDIYAENYSVYELNAPYISFLKLDALATEYKKVFGSFPLEGMKGTLKDFWSLYVCMDTEKFSNIELENDDGTPNIVEPIEMVDKNGVLYYVAITDLPGKGETDVPKVDYRGKPIDVSNMGLFGLKKLSEFRFTDGMINNVMGDLINQLLMINSPATRELHTVPGSEKNNPKGFPQITVPQETCDYLAIMNYNREIAKYLEMKELSITDKATYCWFMNVLIDKHFQTSEFLAPSKYSTVRTSLDTRVMHSMRAIIVPSEGLMDTIGVPDTFLYATFQKEIVDEIEKYLTNTKTYGDEIIDAKEIYLKRTPLALEIYHKMFEPQIDDDGNEYTPAMAQLVRNPTLHKHNFLAFKIKIVQDTSVHLPIAVDEGKKRGG